MEKEKADLEEAKKIFNSYNGSHFFMYKEDIYKKYKSYQISKETEKEWSIELRNKYLQIIESERNESTIINYLISLSLLIDLYKDEEGYVLMLKDIKRKINEVDSFTKIMMAEITLDYVHNLDNIKKYERDIDFVIDELKKVCSEPIRISEYNLEDGKIPDRMKEEKILIRAQISIAAWKDYKISGYKKPTRKKMGIIKRIKRRFCKRYFVRDNDIIMREKKTM